MDRGRRRGINWMLWVWMGVKEEAGEVEGRRGEGRGRGRQNVVCGAGIRLTVTAVGLCVCLWLWLSGICIY